MPCKNPSALSLKRALALICFIKNTIKIVCTKKFCFKESVHETMHNLIRSIFLDEVNIRATVGASFFIDESNCIALILNSKKADKLL
jgi:hypothetical protein